MFLGCDRFGRKGSASVTSDTVAPAAPKPVPDTSTDSMTQTVDIEDSRSMAEGGTAADSASSTATAVKRKTGAAASSRKTPASQSRPAGRTQ